MAPPRMALLLACAWLASCGGDATTSIALQEFLEDVTCNSAGTCVDASGEVASGRWVECTAVASSSASVFSPRGTYIYIDYTRHGTYVEIELDFPTDVMGEAPLVATMREYEAGRLVFESDDARGVIQVAPPSDPGDIPLAGGFNIKFTDSLTDQVREIRNGRFEIATQVAAGESYEPSFPDSTWDDPDFGIVIDIWVVVVDETEPAYEEPVDPTDWSDHDSGGCEGDTYDSDDSYYYDESSGCDGGDWDTTDTDSGFDCEGDTYDEDPDSGFDCEGDTTEALRPSPRAMAALLPLLALFLTRSLVRRKRPRG